MIRHGNIEKTFYRYVSENLETAFGYNVNYGEVRFEANPYDVWLSIKFGEIGAGAKKPSTVRIDVVNRIIGKAFNTEATEILDNIREVFTSTTIQMYDFIPDIPVIIPNEVLLVKNNDGRFTVDRTVLNNLQSEDLKNNLDRSSVFLRLELLTDTVRGRSI